MAPTLRSGRTLRPLRARAAARAATRAAAAEATAAAAAAAAAGSAPARRQNQLLHQHQQQHQQQQLDCSDQESSMDVDGPQVRLRSREGQKFSLSKQEAACSTALLNMLDNTNFSQAEQANCIQLDTADGFTLGRLVDWCRKHADDKPDPAWSAGQAASNDAYGSRVQVELTDWDKNYFKMLPEDELFKLLHLSNFLNVKSLFQAACHAMAKRWEAKRVDDIRKAYGIENDMEPEDEKQIRFECKKFGLDDG